MSFATWHDTVGPIPALLEHDLIDQRIQIPNVPTAISLEYGTHTNAEDIRSLTRGKCLGGRLALDSQLTLSQPLEAWR